MGKWKHRMLDIRPLDMTGTCSNCGRVSVKLKHGIYRCAVSIKEQRGIWKGDPRPRKGYKSGTCPICKEFSNKLIYDHDHYTGKFRGWICTKCNAGIGLLQDNPMILQNALEYLNTKTP